MDRRSTPCARRPRPQLFLYVYLWQPLTALLSAPPAVASTRTTLALRVSCIPSQPTSRALWASLVVPCQSPPILSGWAPCPSHMGTSLSGDSRVHFVATNVLHLLTSCFGAQPRVKPPACVVIAKPPFQNARVSPFHIARDLFLCLLSFL